MSQFDHMTTEELHRKLAGHDTSFNPYTEIASEIRRREKEESTKREEELKKRSDMRFWLNFSVAVVAIIVGVLVAWYFSTTR